MKKLLSVLVCLGLIVTMGGVIGCGDKKADPAKKAPEAKKEEPKKEEPKKEEPKKEEPKKEEPKKGS